MSSCVKLNGAIKERALAWVSAELNEGRRVSVSFRFRNAHDSPSLPTYLRAENLNRKCLTLRAAECYIERKGDPHRSKVLGLFAKRVPLTFLVSDLLRKRIARLWANFSTHCNNSIDAVYFIVKVLFLQISCEVSAYLRNCLISGDYTYHAACGRPIYPKVYILSHFICFTEECMLIVTFETVRVNWRDSE